MSLRPRPRMIWPTIFFMVWAHLSVPITAMAVSPNDTPPATEALPVGGVPAEDDAPVNSDPLPAIGDAASSFGDELPPQGEPASTEPKVEISGDPDVLNELRQQAESQPSGKADRSSNHNLTREGQARAYFTPTNGAGTLGTKPLTIRYTDKHTSMQMGDIPVSLNGNDLVSLNRTVRGLHMNTALAKGNLTGVVSEITAPKQTDTFVGQEMSGPYPLSLTPVAVRSEVVNLNGRTLTRGADYTIDYTAGTITFTRGFRPQVTDSITVTYEGATDGTSGGRLVALRGTYPLGKNLTMGMSHISLSGRDGVRSEESEQYETFVSRNLPGPFFLSYRPIIANSETIVVNNRALPRGTAYTLDYATGKLLFNAGHIPVHGATVEMRYRIAASPQNDGGRSVTGFDVEWKDGKGLGVNLQAAVSAGGEQQVVRVAAESVQDESFLLRNGVPAAQQVFRLRKTPIREGSETVRALSLTLTRNQDYTLDYQTGELRLLNATLPSTQNGTPLFVSYSTQPVKEEASGNSAMSATVTYDMGKVNAMARYRSMDDGFSPLDVGGKSVQQSTEWSASYALSNSLTISTMGENAKSPINQLIGSFAGTGQTLEQNRAYVVDYHQPNQPSVMLQHSSRSSKQVQDERVGDAVTSDSISVSWSKDALSATATLDRSTAKTTQVSMLATSPDEQSRAPLSTMESTVNGASLHLGYRPNERVDVGVSIAANKIESDIDGSKTETGGKSFQANASYRPKDNLNLSANLQSNETDAVKAGGAGIVSPAQQHRSLSLAADWQAKKDVTLGLSYTAEDHDNGEYGQNALSTLAAQLGWKPSDRLSVTGYAAQQQATGLLQGGNSRSTLVGASAQATPVRNTTVSLNVQRLNGANSEGVNQLWQTHAQTMRSGDIAAADVGMPLTNSTSLTAVSGGISYRLGNKHNLALTGETLRGDGELGKLRRDALGIGWHYHADENLEFALDARRVRYADGGDSSLSFTDTELSASLSWHF